MAVAGIGSATCGFKHGRDSGDSHIVLLWGDVLPGDQKPSYPPNELPKPLRSVRR